MAHQLAGVAHSRHADQNEKITKIWGTFLEVPVDGWLLSPAQLGDVECALCGGAAEYHRRKVSGRMHCAPDNAPVELALASTYQTHEPLSGGRVLVRVHHKGEVLIEYPITSRRAALEGHRCIGAALEARDATRSDAATLDAPLRERGCRITKADLAWLIICSRTPR